MRRVKLLIGIIVVLGFGCSEIFEESISGKTVVLTSPQDSAISRDYVPVFQWEKLDGALKYRLQIAKPSFDSIYDLIKDTIITANKLRVSIGPGKYQWRVKAMNGSSETAYSVRSIQIDSTSIGEQVVLTTLPATDSISAQSQVLFQWEQLVDGVTYQIQVDTVNFDEQNLIVDAVAYTNSYSYTFIKEGVYQWRVRAKSTEGVSKWSELKRYVVDQTPPNKVELVFPANGQSISKPISLTWNKVTDASKYKVYVYKSDSTTLVNSSFPVTVNTNSHELTVGESGQKLYWQVSAIDKAGNEGIKSSLRNFTIAQ